MSRWWIPLCLCLIGLILFGDYFANTKNGMAIFTLCLTAFLINFLAKIEWSVKKLLAWIPLIAVILILSLYGIEKHIQSNSMWKSLVADTKVSIDIDHYDAWKNTVSNPPLPINQYGVAVSSGIYARAAWFAAGVRLLSENPQGFGLIHHSFGWLALAKWPDFYQPIGTLRGATHSGWMDMALGVGIPGLLLVLIPLGVAWFRALFHKGLWFSYAAWTIPIMCFAYLTTELTGAHSTEILFFMTAFFCGITLQYPVCFSKKAALHAPTH
jgi:hypothetical protein